MPRYLVEVPHEDSKAACDRAVGVFLQTGSHFLTHADWGCDDAVHKAWFIVEMENKDQALSIVPPLFRRDASVIALRRFTPEDIEEMRGQHAG